MNDLIGENAVRCDSSLADDSPELPRHLGFPMLRIKERVAYKTVRFGKVRFSCVVTDRLVGFLETNFELLER